MRKLLGVFLLLSAQLSHAKGFEDEMQNYFNSLNMVSNVTGASAYQGQRAGFYTGGSLYARSNIRNLQFVRFSWPKVEAGCGGIDLTFGGLSFVKGREFVDFSKNIMNNAQGFAFMLAIEQATPLLGNVGTKAANFATWANQGNLNTCQVSEASVLGLWPRTRQAQQHACQSIGQSKNIFSDWAQARQGCGKGSSNYSYDKVIDGNSNNEEVIDNTNLAWNALKKSDFFLSNADLSELMMSLSGSIIITRDGNGNHFQRLPSLANNRNLISALLKGGSVSMYRCDEQTKCLNPKLANESINPSAGLASKVSELILQMAANIKSNQEQSPEIQGLLASTQYPIMKMISVQMAYMKDSSLVDVTRYSEAIAIDMLFRYLNDNLETIKRLAGVMQYPDAMMKAFQSDLASVRNDLSKMESTAHQRMSIAMQMIQETQTIEQMLAGELSSELNQSLEWASQLR
ncbi:MAG: conjugal transfer protein TraH [Gammaproteobacteria bacterium]|nr:conjugal transfer protein TraH [Gammaproteobacteria bacterium]